MSVSVRSPYLMSCSPQSTQYLLILRRLLACSSSPHFFIIMFSSHKSKEVHDRSHPIVRQRNDFRLQRWVYQMGRMGGLKIVIVIPSRMATSNLSKNRVFGRGGYVDSSLFHAMGSMEDDGSWDSSSARGDPSVKGHSDMQWKFST